MKNFRTHIWTLASAASLLLVFGHYQMNRSATTHGDELTAGVLLGPCGSAYAEGPTGTNDDYTNRSINPGFALTAGGFTTAPGVTVFKNTVENIGPGDDAFIITTRSAPAGFGVEISNDFGAHYTPLNAGAESVTIPVAYRASVTFFVRATGPAGLKVLTGYEVVIRARSTINPAMMNETIDRLYTGFVRLEATARIVGAKDQAEIAHAVSGSEIEFAITYTNISSAQGTGNSLLTAYHIVINQNGNSADNNWATTTDHIVGASDNQGGYIVGDREGSTWLADVVMSLEAGKSGVFKFRRRIK